MTAMQLDAAVGPLDINHATMETQQVFCRALVPFFPMLTVLIAVILIHLHAQPMDVVGTILR